MNSLAMNFYLAVKKNPHFSALKFEYFAISFYRALLLKEINTVQKWPWPLNPPNTIYLGIFALFSSIQAFII